MSKVTNNEIHKLLLQLQQDVNTRCEDITKANEEGNQVLAGKIDRFGERLEKLEQRLDKIDEYHVVHTQKFEEVDGRVEEVEKQVNLGFTSLINRMNIVETEIQRFQEDIPEQLKQLRIDNDKLKEELESRTNRQLRRTLVFKNIPETKDDESYDEVKALLAKTISEHTDIPEDEAVAEIERAHREAKRDGGTRQGKRKIFAAFLNWELPQKILDKFKKRCIEDRFFGIYVDQMYGPLTTFRRNLAFEARKRLKQEGAITSGYVDFPARLMVNIPGDLNRDGKKVYKLHTNFSLHKVESK